MSENADVRSLRSVSVLCSMNEKDFLKHFEGKDLGYVRSMRILINNMYAQAKSVKDELFAHYNKALSEDKEKAERYKTSMEEVYGILFQLEGKYFLLKRQEELRFKG